MQLANDGSLISRRIYWFGPDGHEPGVARLWNLFCKKADRVLEIGSNVGYFTITGAAACRPGVKYLAAEPNPAAFSRLSSNVTINGLDQTVERLPYAIVGSATTRKMTFCVSKLDTYAAQAGSHLAAVSAPAADERVFEVDVLQSSEIIAGVDALKIDAEGAEYDILSAVSQPVAERRCLLVVEVLDAAKILKQFLAGFAKDHGYRIFVIGDALVEVTPDRIADLRVGRTFGSRDVCLVPEEKVEGLVSEFAALGICEICATAGSRLAR